MTGYNGQDLFPQKLTFEEGAGFSINYFKSYKVVNVTQQDGSSLVYILWQCGTPKPSASIPGALYVQIPVTRTAIDATTQIPFIAMVGGRSSIKYDGAGSQYISSPCLLNQIKANITLEIPLTTDTFEPVDYSIFTPSNINVLWYSGYWNASKIQSYGTTPVLINPSQPTPIAIFAWIQFVASFYNAEGTISDLLPNALARYNCNRDQVTKFTSAPYNLVKPKVLWASWNDYSNAWIVGSPGNYYEILIKDAGGIFLTGFPGDLTSVSNTDFITLAKTADVWLYSDINWDTINKTLLINFPSYVNQRIFDFQFSGVNDWFENRLVEPDVVLEGLTAVIQPNLLHPNGYHRIWWRNVFTETIGANIVGTCSSTDALGAQHQVYAATCGITYPGGNPANTLQPSSFLIILLGFLNLGMILHSFSG